MTTDPFYNCQHFLGDLSTSHHKEKSATLNSKIVKTFSTEHNCIDTRVE
jgi:hypothetical protein